MNMIQTSISQYSLPDGKSACTCIAIEMSSSLLKYLNNNSDNINIQQFLTADRLQSMILAGSDLYNSLKQSQSDISSEVEHLSPEEVLAFLHSSKPDTSSSSTTTTSIRFGGMEERKYFFWRKMFHFRGNVALRLLQ
mmetsp:Transcript_16059/g.23976  ORF Transcript_16059/g.23976 Transcript_16059/m.23976 type:complete len:137 (+) Transcript_16059:448-858(+)